MLLPLRLNPSGSHQLLPQSEPKDDFVTHRSRSRFCFQLTLRRTLVSLLSFLVLAAFAHVAREGKVLLFPASPTSPASSSLEFVSSPHPPSLNDAHHHDAQLDRFAGWEWAFETSIVYTWVNGSDPVYRQQREKYGGRGALGGSRDRDNNDLVYSMRSLEENMNWSNGTIYLVAPSVPSWLDLSHPRIKFVPQDNIIPAEYNPVFNSNAVEQYLHLIPGITERYIQINDDCLIFKPTHPKDFFTSERGIKLFLEKGEIHPPDQPSSKIWLGAVYKSVSTLQDRIGPIQHDWPRFLKHAPFVYSKKVLEELHGVFDEVLRETSTHRFRSSNDVITPLLHHTYLTQFSNQLKISYRVTSEAESDSDYVLIKWTPDLAENARALEDALDINPLFLTINDELGDEHAKDTRLAQSQLVRVYQDLFPDKSAFERS